MKAYTIYDEFTGLVLETQYHNEGEQPINATDVDCTISAVKLYFDAEKKLFYDGATQEEIIEATVPKSIIRMNLKIQLLKKSIQIEDVEQIINEIPDYLFSKLEKKIAIIKFNEASTFDRYNADLNLVATLLGLSQQDLNEIFINGNQEI